MTRHSPDPNPSRDEVNVLECHEKYSWFVNVNAEDADGPGFAYSFVLYEEFKHPEIVSFGLPGEKVLHL